MLLVCDARSGWRFEKFIGLHGAAIGKVRVFSGCPRLAEVDAG